jgi:hypothetical protein
VSDSLSLSLSLSLSFLLFFFARFAAKKNNFLLAFESSKSFDLARCQYDVDTDNTRLGL